MLSKTKISHIALLTWAPCFRAIADVVGGRDTMQQISLTICKFRVSSGSRSDRFPQKRPDTDDWEWSCGFYPSRPGEHAHGTSASFDEARADFEATWAIFLHKRTEADFQAWRDQRDWTERKYAMWARGERLPTQMPNTIMRCPCGEVFESHRLEHTMTHVPHISVAHAADGIRR
jgi:hypothetical protein